MRIAVITTSYPRRAGDGAGHFVEAEVEKLRALGHEIVVLCPRDDEDAFGWPGALARLRERPLRTLGALRFVIRVGLELRSAAPFDRVIAHWLVPSAFPIALAERAPLEVVVHGSDVDLLEKLPPFASRVVVSLLHARRASFRFVSRELCDRLTQLSGIDLADAARVEPCAIDVAAAPSRGRARRTLGLGDDRELALIVGRLVPGKRTERAIAAATLLPAALVVVVGDGPERADLELRFPGVRFVGHISRTLTLTWIAAADVLVSASRAEGAPTAIREARALGVPVVTPPAGDLALWAATDADLHLVS